MIKTSTVLLLAALQLGTAFATIDLLATAESYSPALITTIKLDGQQKYRYQPWCVAYFSCNDVNGEDYVVTEGGKTFTYTDPYGIDLQTLSGWTIRGTVTIPKIVPVATVLTTDVTSITVGEFTQTDTDIETTSLPTDAPTKRSLPTPALQGRSNNGKRRLQTCPDFAPNVKQDGNDFTDSQWLYIVQYACAKVLDEEIGTEFSTVEVAPETTTTVAPETWTVPEFLITDGIETAESYITTTQTVQTYDVVFSYTTETVSTTTTISPSPVPTCAATIDLQTDVNNCGTCGNACATDYNCSAGKCVPFCSQAALSADTCTVNQVKNGGFGSGTTGWTLTASSSGGRWNLNPGRGPESPDAHVYFSGNGGKISQATSAVAGKLYTVTFYTGNIYAGTYDEYVYLTFGDLAVEVHPDTTYRAYTFTAEAYGNDVMTLTGYNGQAISDWDSFSVVPLE